MKVNEIDRGPGNDQPRARSEWAVPGVSQSCHM